MLKGGQVFISLGSNSPDAECMLTLAREGISALPGVKMVAASRIYRTEPQGFAEQPWFRNQVLELQVCGWTAPDLLDAFLHLETRLGRVRTGERFGPRCIDIDLLLFGRERSPLEYCILPHPRMTERAFVLLPLSELAPDVLINGKKPGRWLDGLAWRLDGDKIYQSN